MPLELVVALIAGDADRTDVVATAARASATASASTTPRSPRNRYDGRPTETVELGNRVVDEEAFANEHLPDATKWHAKTFNASASVMHNVSSAHAVFVHAGELTKLVWSAARARCCCRRRGARAVHGAQPPAAAHDERASRSRRS